MLIFSKQKTPDFSDALNCLSRTFFIHKIQNEDQVSCRPISGGQEL